jgi:hypothetical protein
MNVVRNTITALAVLAWSLWMGGFTFYTAVSLRVAHKVLDDSRSFGFVTQIVMERLNLIGLATVCLLVLHLICHGREMGRSRLMAMTATTVTLAITLGLLFNLHQQIELLLDPQVRVVVDDTAFRPLHNRYELIATIQWFVAIIHLVLLLVRPGPSPIPHPENPIS